VTALDHFLLGEQYRKEAAGLAEGETQQKAGRADPALTEKALAAYREALGQDPDHYWSHLQLSRCLISVGRYAEAVAALGACVALRPESPWAYSIRGNALALLKRYPEAESDLNRAVELSPESRPARLNRGLVFWTRKRNAEALADFEAVLQPPKEKQLVEAAYYRGQLYLQEGKVDQALADFDRVVADNPSFRPVYPHRALILIAQGKKARALADLDAFLADQLAMDRPAWQRHGQRGRLLRLLYTELPAEQRRKPSGQALGALAMDELNEAVNRGARAAAVFDDLGALLELQGHLNEAIAAYDRGLKLAPKDVKLLNKRGWALSNVNQNDKALADFRAAVAVDPENAEAHSGLGFVQALHKLPPEAQQQAELALLHGTELRAPDNYLNLHNVACIYAALSANGDKQATAHQDVAMALLRRAVRLWEKEGGGPNEIDMIKGDPTFKPLSGRDDFQELIGLKPPRKKPAERKPSQRPDI
jgi:tetratricopeptide (TPR) repeat protein